MGSSFDSGAPEALPHVGWSLYVSLCYGAPYALNLRHGTQPRLGLMRLHTRWEFVITLYYEWRVIQGRQPYGWTIWVSDYRCFVGHRYRYLPMLVSLGLTFSLSRYIPLRASPRSWP